MKIEVFEISGFSTEMNDRVDSILMEIKKRDNSVEIKKIDMNTQDMTEYPDVFENFKGKTAYDLPVVRLDGKLVTIKELEEISKTL